MATLHVVSFCSILGRWFWGRSFALGASLSFCLIFAAFGITGLWPLLLLAALQGGTFLAIFRVEREEVPPWKGNLRLTMFFIGALGPLVSLWMGPNHW
jgi:hypothetical protein